MMHTFANKIITFLLCSVSVEKAFLDAEGDFDVCINCAAETRYGQSEEVSNAKFFIHIFFTCCKTLLLSSHGSLGGTINAIRVESLVTCVYVRCKNFCVNYKVPMMLCRYNDLERRLQRLSLALVLHAFRDNGDTIGTICIL